MGNRGYRSIGETLDLIKEEFPEVTISKIRFLETQGLIAPERTTNGYRKFYDHDIERLSFVLRQQREQFLPLKVIKDRITEKEPGVFVLDPSKGRFAGGAKVKSSKFEKDIFGDPLVAPAGNGQSKHKPKVEDKTLPVYADQRPSPGRGGKVLSSEAGNAYRRGEPTADKRVVGDPSSRAKATKNPNSPYQEVARIAATQTERNISGDRPPRLFALPTASSLAEKLDDFKYPSSSQESRGEAEDISDADSGSDFPKSSFTSRDIAEQAGLTLVQVGELTTFGLLSPTTIRSQLIYCSADLELAILAREFARFGLEARHLKMYKLSADREASFLEQVIVPILANRSQKSRAKAESALTQLGEVGSQFRTLLLERAIEKIIKS